MRQSGFYYQLFLVTTFTTKSQKFGETLPFFMFYSFILNIPLFIYVYLHCRFSLKGIKAKNVRTRTYLVNKCKVIFFKSLSFQHSQRLNLVRMTQASYVTRVSLLRWQPRSIALWPFGDASDPEAFSSTDAASPSGLRVSSSSLLRQGISATPLHSGSCSPWAFCC